MTSDEQKQFQKINEELREIAKEEETKIILKVLKDIFNKDNKKE